MDDTRPFEAALTITGSAGEIHMHNPLSPHAGHEIRTCIDGVVTVETCAGATTYDHQLAHVLVAMRQEEEAFLGGQDAIANMHVIDQVYRAAGMLPRLGSDFSSVLADMAQASVTLGDSADCSA